MIGGKQNPSFFRNIFKTINVNLPEITSGCKYHDILNEVVKQLLHPRIRSNF
jgi:hypothetical protein